MRIAVTGATGTIGKAFLRLARHKGHRFTLLGRTRPAKLADGDDWIPFDLAAPPERGQLVERLSRADSVLHLAARIDTDPSDDEAAIALFAANVLGTGRLIDIMAHADVRRIVMASSANVYDPRVACATEDTPIRPLRRTLYLSSKAAQESYAREKCRDAGVACAVMRVSSVVGTGDDVITKFVRSARRGEPIALGDPDYGADFVDVVDVAEGLMIAVEQSLSGEFNLSSGKRHTLGEIIAKIGELDGLQPETADRPASAAGAGFPAIDCAKLRGHGYAPRCIEEVISGVVARTDGTLAKNLREAVS